jgi:Pyruvate/2-oxoacid:ferredoxin oxidoreductase gamma subunit
MVLDWLHGARMNDYVDIVMNNPDEFNAFLHCIDQLLDPLEDINQLKKYLQELDYHILKINNLNKKKEKELRSNGIETVIGVALTFGLLAIPNELENMKNILSTIISGNTLYEGINCIKDFVNKSNQFKENDFWVLWKSLDPKIIRK